MTFNPRWAMGQFMEWAKQGAVIVRQSDLATMLAHEATEETDRAMERLVRDLGLARGFLSDSLTDDALPIVASPPEPVQRPPEPLNRLEAVEGLRAHVADCAEPYCAHLRLVLEAMG